MTLFTKKLGRKAQTATELAIFGAILLFVIGIIVRQALSFGHVQNQNLRALRMAMRLSYEHSMGLRPSIVQDPDNTPVGNTSRNFATVLLVEDRLSADSAKYGALNRSPVIANAQAAHSRNLFMPIDVGDPYSEPIFDMFINGKHFPFTTAKFKTICMTQTEAQCPGGHDIWIGGPETVRNGVAYDFWQANCVTRFPASGGPQPEGCPKLYTVTPNNPENISWWSPGQGNGFPCSNPAAPACADIYSTDVCPSGPCPNPYTQFSIAERFDLSRDGGSEVTGSTLQNNFGWQWLLVAGFDRDDQLRSKAPLRLNYGEFFSFGLEEGSEQKHVVLDVDNDLKEERVIRNSLLHNSFGVIQQFTVLDSQDGDLDFSYNTKDYLDARNGVAGAKEEPGLMQGVAMYTRVRPGTYLEIKEGRLYSPSGQVVRNIQRKDHIDIIQRMIRVSNNTGRFCDAGGRNTDPAVWDDIENPVEVCAANCFDGSNTSLTCYDTDSDIIFVRSRVADEFGHQWITDTTSDDYVTFVTAPLP